MPQGVDKQTSRLQLVVFTFSRLFINTALRMVYPFLPAFARGAGVSLTDISRLIALRSAVGLSSPLFSPLSDRYGRRFALMLAMVLFSAGNFAVFLRPTYWLLAGAFILTGAAKVIFDPAAQSYLGDTIPYEQRGRAFSILELSWSGALLLGAPAVGFVLERQGWSAPFAWLGALGLLSTFLLWAVMPARRAADRTGEGIKHTVATLRQQPIIWAVSLYMLLIMGANEVLLIVFGAWIEEQFALNIASLGLAAAVIGAAELTGELSSGVAVDHFGKRPVVITTALLAGLGYLLIPLLGFNLGAVLALLFLLFVAFEITIVGGLPLLSETLPQARTVLLSMALAAGSAGRMLGALVGPYIWRSFGLVGVCLTAALVTVAAVVVLALWIREAPAVQPKSVEVS